MKDDANAPQPPAPNTTADQPAVETPRLDVEAEQPTQAGPSNTPGPVASATDAPVSTVVGAAPKKSKKKWIISGIIALALALLVGGAAAAYAGWYQNPNKVLTDAFVNVLKAKSAVYTGTIDLTSKDTTSPVKKAKITIEGKGNTVDGEFHVAFEADYNGKNVVIAGSAIVDKDSTLYIKIKDIRKTLQSIAGGQMAIPAPYDALITKIDNKWIKISPDDITQFDSKYKERQTCLTEAAERLMDDKDAMNEVATLYQNNTFIVVKEQLGSKNGSLGYLVEGDTDKTKSFLKGLNDTKLFKEIQKCDASIKIDDSMLNSSSSGLTTTPDGETRVKLWVDRWSHQLTNVTVEGKSSTADGTISIDTQFDVPVTVEAPTTDIVTFDELKKEIEMIYTQSATGLQQQSLQQAAPVNTI